MNMTNLINRHYKFCKHIFRSKFGLAGGIVFVKKKHKLKRGLEQKKIQEMKELFETISKKNEQGNNLDTIAGTYGKFGHEVTNPIPVSSILANKNYLDSLMTSDGQKISYKRIGSCYAPNIDFPIDKYQIFSQDREIAVLFISSYHKKVSEKVPEGFKKTQEKSRFSWQKV